MLEGIISKDDLKVQIDQYDSEIAELTEQITNKSESKKVCGKKNADKKTASTRSTAKTTDEPALKRTGGRKKKSATPKAAGESQTKIPLIRCLP